VGRNSHPHLMEHNMSEIDLKDIKLSWYNQIIEHIKITLDHKIMSNADKVESIRWLVRQLDSENKDDR
jgi:DNA-binding transcriptional regulator YhcF (GntR family)